LLKICATASGSKTEPKLSPWLIYLVKTDKTANFLLVETEGGADSLAEARAFHTTRWSLVISAADSKSGEQKSREALAELCRTYWRPIFLFISRRGYSLHEAQDLTQDFFLYILESDWLQHADRQRGRFRSFLLKSLQNFLSHAHEKDATIKRGGKLEFISWDDLMKDATSELPASTQTLDSLPPEHLFDLCWATTVVEHALQRLREECKGKGRLRLYETLSGHLASERGDVSYASLAAALGTAEAMVKFQLHNLRQRYRWLLRDEVAHTVEEQADIGEEIRHLCAVLASVG
jgi:DNA-directed RNA polymerase specialized sigma24 family protein